MKNRILMVLTVIIFVCSCKKDEFKRVDKVITVQYDLEILKGTKAELKVNAGNIDYHFNIDYSYTKSIAANAEGWSILLGTSTKMAGYHAEFDTGSFGISTLEKGVLIDESQFQLPTTQGYFLVADRVIGNTTFNYEKGFKTEFYKFYNVPIKFKTIDKNAQAGPPFYGWMLIYVHPDKLIIGNIVFNTGGKVFAGN